MGLVIEVGTMGKYTSYILPVESRYVIFVDRRFTNKCYPFGSLGSLVCITLLAVQQICLLL